MDHLIDARDLEPPEPMERTLDALATLPAGDRLVLRLHRQPFPLFDLLRRMGYLWEVGGTDGDYRILIRAADAPSPDATG
jgi:TusA-related sulfurtransferase